MAVFGLARLLGSSAATGLALALIPPSVALTACELERQEIPDWTSLWIAGLGVFRLSQDGNWLSFAVTIGCAVALWAVLGYISGRLYARRDGQEVLGLGDVKLMAAMVLILGLTGFPMALFLASLGGISAIVISGKKEGGLPFGPMLAFATFLVCLGTGFDTSDWLWSLE